MMTLFKNIKELVQVRTESVRFIAGAQMKELPTIKNAFLLIDEGRIKEFCHIDVYRLNSGAELLSLGVEEFFSSLYAVTLIEWADKVQKIWPKKTRVIKIRALSLEQREIIFF